MVIVICLYALGESLSLLKIRRRICTEDDCLFHFADLYAGHKISQEASKCFVIQRDIYPRLWAEL